jgi:hypothetical protein
LNAGAVTGTTLLVDGGQHLTAQSRDVMFLARGPWKRTNEQQHPIARLPPPVLAGLRSPHQHRGPRLRKTGEQRVLINVDLFVPLAASTPKEDKLSEVLDYDFIRRTVKERVARGHIHLQETLADDLLALMLAHPQGAGSPRFHREARRVPRLRSGGRRSIRHQGRPMNSMTGIQAVKKAAHEANKLSKKLHRQVRRRSPTSA